MEKQTVFPILALVGGALCGATRFLNLRTGFDPTTGLALPQDWSGLVLVGLLGLFAVASVVVAWMLIPNEPRALGQGFSPDSISLMLFAAGALLLVASGGIQIGSSLGVNPLDVLAGALLAAGGLALLSQTAIFGKKTKKGPDTILFLLPVLSVIILLILAYRSVSINPVMGVYYVEILAYCAVLLALFQLFVFAAGLGQGRIFCPLATMAIVLSCVTLVEGHTLSTNAFFLGNAMLLLGCLLGSQQTK